MEKINSEKENENKENNYLNVSAEKNYVFEDNETNIIENKPSVEFVDMLDKGVRQCAI